MKLKLVATALVVLGLAGPAPLSAADITGTGTEVPLLINSDALKWVKTIPEAGDQSPEYALLNEDPTRRKGSG